MSNVTAVAFRDSVFAAFDAFWLDRTSVEWQGKPFDPGTLASYASVHLQGTPGGQTRYSNSVDPHHFSRAGTFTVTCSVRQDRSTDTVYALAEAATQFMEKPSIADAVFSNVSPPVELGPDGTWFKVSVSSDYLYFTDRAA